MGEPLPNHQDHIAGEGGGGRDKSLQHYNLVRKFIPMPQTMKITAAWAAMDKEREKLEKDPAWNLTKVRSKKQVIGEPGTGGAKVHFASLMEICHLKNAELEGKHQKHKGRVVLRGDFVKDDSGSYAAFTEQRSSASQMTAAKIMDNIPRLPGCAGQAADAISAYTQVKMEEVPKIIENSQIGMSRHLDSSTTTQVAKIMENPIVPLERNLNGHLLARLLWEKLFEKILLQHGWEKIPNWECLFVHREQRIILICVCGWTSNWLD